MSCVICKKSIQLNEEKVLCNGCKLCYAHDICIKSETKVETNKPGRKPKWICGKCKAEKKDNEVSDASGDDEKKGDENKGEKSMADLLLDIYKRLDKVDKIERDTSIIKEVKETAEYLSSQYDDLLERFDKQDKTIKKMSNEIQELKEKVNKKDNEVSELNCRVQELEQERLSMNIEIHGMPMVTGENTRDVIDNIAKVIDAPPATQTVEDCYRVFANPKNVRKQGVPPIVVVKFNSTEARRVWLDRSKTRNLTVGKVQGNTKEEKLFVCEHLTPDLKRLFYKTRTAAKVRGWKFVWVRDGKILAKKTEDTGTIRIKCDDDFDRRMPGAPF